MAREKSPIRILRVIARMNLGGPAHHVAVLSDGLDRRDYETLLVSGRVGEGEEEHTDLDVPMRPHSTRSDRTFVHFRTCLR